MSLIIFMIGITFILVGLFLAAFLWATHTGQFEDLTTPAYRILSDEFSDKEVPYQKDMPYQYEPDQDHQHPKGS